MTDVNTLVAEKDLTFKAEDVGAFCQAENKPLAFRYIVEFIIHRIQ